MKSNPTFLRPWRQLLAALLLFCFQPAISQGPSSENWSEAGRPDLNIFRPGDIHDAAQIHKIVEDNRGIIYAAGDKGVLEFDGVNWRLIELPQQAAVRTICYANDTLFVGGQGDLGYLNSDRHGTLIFTSLKDKIPAEHQDFKNIWEILAIADTLYFRGYYAIFRRVNNKITVWKPQTVFHNALVANRRFYVREVKTGLKVLHNDSLVLAPQGEKFEVQVIAAMLPMAGGRQLVITRLSGWFIYDGQTFMPLKTPADDFLKSSLVMDAAQLPGGFIALATQRRGLAITDIEGRLLRVIDKSAGLPSKILHSVHRDRLGGLWSGSSNGLARLEIPSPLTHFDEADGLEGHLYDMVRYEGTLYAATNFGVFYLDSNRKPLPAFIRIDGISNTSYALLPHQNGLFIGTHLGLFRLDGRRVVASDFYMTKTNHNASVTTITPARENPRRAYVGGYQSLHILDWDENADMRMTRVPGFKNYVLKIVEDRLGGLWVGTRQGVAYLAKKLGDNPRIPQGTDFVTRHYGSGEGLPAGAIRPALIDGRIIFAGSAGLFRFDVDSQRFLPDSLPGAAFIRENCAIQFLQQDAAGNIWLIGKENGEPLLGRLRKQPDGGYRWQNNPFARFSTIGNIRTIYPEQNGVAWFGGSEGLGRYSPAIQQNSAGDFPALVRRVVANSDSIVYGGALISASGKSGQPELPVFRLPFSANNLRFDFASTSFENSTRNRYQILLQGFDKKPSPWISETYKDYTGLPAGDYIFRVRAQNVYRQFSTEDTFAFSIVPPWYQSWWAWLLYALGVGGLLVLLVRLRVRQLQIKTRQLEDLVAKRTETVRQQADKLQELNRVKSRFFANISHEFRTPLTLILGPLEDYMARAKDAETRNDFSTMHRNAQRLLQLINQLLDLSRLESGRMTLQARRGDFENLLRGLVMSFSSLAEQRQIKLHFSSTVDPVLLEQFYFDHDKIEKIFINLLSNAFKFTPSGGEIGVKISIVNRQSPGRKYVSITVEDSGPGIPEADLPHIFERFYQADPGIRYDQQGSGIGLALARELVEAHHGQITVDSEFGRGSAFSIYLPLGSDAFAAGEIVEAEAAELPLPSAPEMIPVAPADDNPGHSPVDENATIVLIVDDHPDVRRYIRRHLPEEFSIAESANGHDGLTKALEIVPDLIISDIMMPEMDGYEFCQALKTNQKTSHIPVILLTARAGEADKLAGLETGADDYLTKPFNSREMLARVNNLIESRRLLRERYRQEGFFNRRPAAGPSAEKVFVEKLMQALEENLAEEDFSVEKLSGMLNMGRRQLHRKIRALTGQSPSELISSMRLHRARQMLQDHSGTVSEIAYAVGFNNLSYFAKIFREEFGQAPSQLLKK